MFSGFRSPVDDAPLACAGGEPGRDLDCMFDRLAGAQLAPAERLSRVSPSSGAPLDDVGEPVVVLGPMSSTAVMLG